MTDRNECRQPACHRPPRAEQDDLDAFAARFCSTACELRYDHVRADAREARRDAQREARTEESR